MCFLKLYIVHKLLSYIHRKKICYQLTSPVSVMFLLLYNRREGEESHVF